MQASSEILCSISPPSAIIHPLVFAQIYGNTRHSHTLHTVLLGPGPCRRLEEEVLVVWKTMERLSGHGWPQAAEGNMAPPVEPIS